MWDALEMTGECRFCKDKCKFGGPGIGRNSAAKNEGVLILFQSVPITLDTMSVR